jgi:hypothetical protein
MVLEQIHTAGVASLIKEAVKAASSLEFVGKATIVQNAWKYDDIFEGASASGADNEVVEP